MATYFGINADFAGGFFSGMNNSISGTYGGSSILTDYASIRNGSYKKLLTNYYDKNKDASFSPATAKGKDSTKELAALKTDAEALKDSAADLYKGSLFKEKDIKDEKTGEMVKGYDYAKITDAVKSFVDDYNKMIKSGGKANTKSIVSATDNLKRATAVYSKQLGKAGITVNEDSTLTMDADKIKKANISDLKNLFQGTGSYAYQTSAKASMIYNSANSATMAAKMYNGAGAYSYMSTGDLFNGLY